MKKTVLLVLVVLCVGCDQGGNRVVDTSEVDVELMSPEQLQKEAEADLPKP